MDEVEEKARPCWVDGLAPSVPDSTWRTCSAATPRCPGWGWAEDGSRDGFGFGGRPSRSAPATSPSGCSGSSRAIPASERVVQLSMTEVKLGVPLEVAVPLLGPGSRRRSRPSRSSRRSTRRTTRRSASLDEVVEAGQGEKRALEWLERLRRSPRGLRATKRALRRRHSRMEAGSAVSRAGQPRSRARGSGRSGPLPRPSPESRRARDISSTWGRSRPPTPPR